MHSEDTCGVAACDILVGLHYDTLNHTQHFFGRDSDANHGYFVFKMISFSHISKAAKNMFRVHAAKVFRCDLCFGVTSSPACWTQNIVTPLATPAVNHGRAACIPGPAVELVY